MEEDLEAARERRFWSVGLRAITTAAVVALVAAATCGAAARLGWWARPFPCATGSLAGGAVAVAFLGSRRGREVAGLVVGAVTLPLLALAGAWSRGAVEAYAAPFVAHAAATLLAAAAVSLVWRGLRPAAAEPAAATAVRARAARGEPARLAQGGPP